MKKRMISLLLCLGMVLSMVPAIQLQVNAATDKQAFVAAPSGKAREYVPIKMTWHTTTRVSTAAVNDNIRDSYIELLETGMVPTNAVDVGNRFWEDPVVADDSILCYFGIDQLQKGGGKDGELTAEVKRLPEFVNVKNNVKLYKFAGTATLFYQNTGGSWVQYASETLEIAASSNKIATADVDAVYKPGEGAITVDTSNKTVNCTDGTVSIPYDAWMVLKGLGLDASTFDTYQAYYNNVTITGANSTLSKDITGVTVDEANKQILIDAAAFAKAYRGSSVSFVLRADAWMNDTSVSIVSPTVTLTAAHPSTADDGDCTTAVNCSGCGIQQTAALTHTFDNDADATCNNAGCTYKRSVHDHDGAAFEGLSAWTQLEGGGRYYLTDSSPAVSGNLTVAKGTQITLCLNGKTLELGDFSITNKGDLTVCDCTGSGSISGTDICLYNQGTLRLSGGTVTSRESRAISNSGDLTLSNGTVRAKEEGIYNQEAGTVTMTGGVVHSDFDSIYSYGAVTVSGGELVASSGITLRDSGSVIFSGGTITGENSGIRSMQEGSVTVSGGKITGGTYGIDNGYSGDVSISAGEISGGTWAVYNGSGTVKVTGGSITSNANGLYNGGSGSVTMTGGTVTSSRGSGITNKKDGTVSLSGGTVKAGEYGISIQGTGSVYLSGAPTVTGGSSYASVYSAGSLYAKNQEGTAAYTGGALTIKLPSLVDGKVVVYQVTDSNRDSFSLVQASGYRLKPSGSNLVLEKAHAHAWEYAANGATLTAECTASGTCDYTGADLELTITAPKMETYGDSKSADAALSASTLAGTALPKVKYVGRDGTTYTETTAAPTNAGKYTASITVGGKTARVDYEIAKATPTDVSWPAGLECEVGKTLSTIGLPEGFAWVEPNRIIEYGHEYYAMRYLPDAQNYEPVTEDVKVRELDRVAPTGEISIQDNKWNTFLNSITFGLFFKQTQTVTITAEDNAYGAGIDEIFYYIAAEEKTVKELGDMAITAWEEGDTFNISPEKKCIIYVRIIDKAANEVYLSSNGLVFFKDTEVISGDYAYTRTTKADVATRIKPGNNTVNMVDICEPGGGAGDSLSYHIDAEGYLVLDGESVEAFAQHWPTGDYTVTVTYDALGQEYVTGTSTGDRIADTVLTLEVKPCPVAKPAADPAVFTYNGKEQTYTVTPDPAYRVTGAQRTVVGEQTVTVALADKNTYCWEDGTNADLTFSFQIGEAAFTAQVQQAEPLTYNGAEQTAFISTLARNVQGNQSVTYRFGLSAENCTGDTVPAFRDAGTYTVYFLASAPNHKDATGSFAVTVDQKTLGIDWKAPADLVYDGTAKVPVATATGLVGSDKLSLPIALSAGQDNVRAGSFTYQVNAIQSANYKLPADVTSPAYTIAPRPLQPSDFMASTGGFVYTGGEHKPAVESKNTLVTANDYTVSYENNINAGENTAKLILAGQHNASGKVEIPFSIAKADPAIGLPGNLKSNTVLNGQTATLAAVALPQGIAWNAPQTPVAYGAHAYPVTVTPDDTDNYNILQRDVQVTGLDVTTPTGTVRIAAGSWNKFWTGTHFETYYNQSQTVTVTALDTESGVKKTAYYLSETELTAQQAGEVTDWTGFTGSFTIDPDNRYVVYVKLTDNAGNSAILNSDGVVLDNILPVLSGVENGKTYYQSVEVTVTDENLQKVEVDGTEVPVTEGKFTLTAGEGPQIIRAYDKAGNVSDQVAVTVEAEHAYVWGNWAKNQDSTQTRTGQCVCDAQLTITAPQADDVYVSGMEQEAEQQDQDLHLVVETDQGRINADAMAAIGAPLEAHITAEFVDITVLTNEGAPVSQTANVLEIPLKANFEGKLDIQLYRHHGGQVQQLTQLAEKPAGAFTDGTCYLDFANSVIYIYSNQFSVYGVAYHAHALTHVEAKAATQEADGNIEYWYCPGCDSYFTDQAAQNEITQPETVVKYIPTPVTGDNFALWLWLGMLLLSAAAVLALGTKLRKR